MNVVLVQSGRFPNLWSLVGEGNREWCRLFRDPMFENGAMGAENAVTYAREHGHRITAVQAHYSGPRDTWQEVIAGIEYRSRRPVIDSGQCAVCGALPTDLTMCSYCEDRNVHAEAPSSEDRDPYWMNP